VREEGLRQQLNAAIDMYEAEMRRRMQLQAQLETAETIIRRQAAEIQALQRGR
jgi:hypothetical protein